MSSSISHQPSAENALSRTLLVRGLKYGMDKSFLSNLFSFTDEMLISVKVIKSDKTGPLEGGDGFLEFKTRDFAQRVLDMYNGFYMPDGVNKLDLVWATHIPEDNHGKYVIVVSNLADNVTDFVLQNHFKCVYNSVKEAKVEIDEATHCSKGRGYVKFNDKIEQLRALVEMQGELCSQKPMKIEQFTEKISKASS